MPLGSVLQSPQHFNGAQPYLNPDGTPMQPGGYPQSMSPEEAAAAGLSSGLSYQQQLLQQYAPVMPGYEGQQYPSQMSGQ